MDDEKREWILVHNPDIILLDGLDYALVGVSERINQPTIAVYDIDKIIALLIARDKLSESEAYDHLYYNIIGAYMGETTPCFMTTYDF